MTTVPRPKPYIWVTWLARVMAGEVACHWQYWYQAHHLVRDKQPSDFDHVAWGIAHTRLLTDLRREVARPGVRMQTEFRFSIHVPPTETTVAGKVDCLVDDGQNLVVYDCKTGQPRDAHRVQVMLYMHALGSYERFADRRIRGMVVYPDSRFEIPYLPPDFRDQVEYFVAQLADRATPALKAPGEGCRYCALTLFDCPDREE